MKIVLIILLILCSVGCATGGRSWLSLPTNMDTVTNIAAPTQSCSPMLGWIGGICTLSGMALLVLTGGRMGWKPVIGGIIFIVINYALAMYASWIFLPVVIATGGISLAWAGKIIWKIVNDDDIKFKEIL